MKTKIVYALVSNGKAVYFERAFVSAWSAKHYNPSAKITIVIDDKTKEALDKETYANFMNLIDEEIVVTFDSSCSNMEKSRWMKTNLRKLIKGDFLFLDVDTIVCASLSDIDKEVCSIGFAWDFNCTFHENPQYKNHKRLMKTYFLQDISSDDYYFNSGVIYVKDDDIAHTFFTEWHKNWLHTKNQGYFRDQLSLLKTTHDNRESVSEISGIYNCQMSINLQYFYDAKILHFYKIQGEFNMSPFFDDNYYIQIREEKNISNKLCEEILNCKSSFKGPTMLLGGIDLEIIGSNVYRLVRKIFSSHPGWLVVIKGISNMFFKIFK